MMRSPSIGRFCATTHPWTTLTIKRISYSWVASSLTSTTSRVAQRLSGLRVAQRLSGIAT